MAKPMRQWLPWWISIVSILRPFNMERAVWKTRLKKKKKSAGASLNKFRFGPGSGNFLSDGTGFGPGAHTDI